MPISLSKHGLSFCSFIPNIVQKQTCNYIKVTEEESWIL
ncbi:hypothetical protein VCHA53O466_50332 [Vibrio chagasii]|nr:hypothetical protein VCHA53O466_50332 [Vibrio chagasii]